MPDPCRNLASHEAECPGDGTGVPSNGGDLIPEIRKLQGHRELVPANGSDDGLQFVATFAVDADFISLNLRRDLEFAVANETGDLLGHIGGNALLHFDLLP